MNFSIHKQPTKVLFIGLLGYGFYFALAVALFRRNEFYFLFLGAGVFGIAILVVKSIGSAFFSSLTVTDRSIETVTTFGGIIKIGLDDLDWDRTIFSEAGLLLVPRTGESLMVSAAEYSRKDIARLAHHIGSIYGVQES